MRTGQRAAQSLWPTTQKTYHADRQDIDHYDRDLNPDRMAGRNVAGERPDAMLDGTTSNTYDVKAIHRQFNELSAAELKAIPILPVGARLQQGATYIDLLGDHNKMAATSDMIVGKGNSYVPKDSVDYQFWSRLIGVNNPERTGQADDSSVVP